MPVVGRDWARPWLRATTYPAGFHSIAQCCQIRRKSPGLGEGWGTAIGCGVTSGYGALFCLIPALGTYLARANLRI